jgi:hypothetical protein
MDPMVIELLKGPQGPLREHRLHWLKQAHFAFASATDGSLSMIAEPVKAAIDVIEAIDKKPGASEQEKMEAEARLNGHLLHAQGLALYCYLEALNKMRNAIAAEVAKLKPGSPDRKKGERLQYAYEQTIDALARAYNGLRAGNLEEMKAIGPALDEARKIAAELRD